MNFFRILFNDSNTVLPQKPLIYDITGHLIHLRIQALTDFYQQHAKEY